MNENKHPLQNPVKTNEVFLGTQIIISAKNQRREYPYNFARHIHKSIEIYLIDKGTCAMDINNQNFTFQTNDFIVIYPNTIHSFYLPEKCACSFRHIHFNPVPFSKWYFNQDSAYPMNLITALILPCRYFLHLRSDNRISTLMDCIIQESNETGFLASSMVNLHMAELLIYLIKLSNPNPTLISDSSPHIPDQIQYVSYALSYIHKNFSKKILIPDIASHLNISARYLSKVFFQHMNLTILNYINIYRINQAIDLMSDTNLTLTEISVQIGLKDSQHFSKLFRNIIGLPPNQYRKLILHDMTEDMHGETEST